MEWHQLSEHAGYFLMDPNLDLAPPVSTIIYTHHHWDHTWGACAYDAGLEIIAHERTVALREEMSQIRLHPASERFLRARSKTA